MMTNGYLTSTSCDPVSPSVSLPFRTDPPYYPDTVSIQPVGWLALAHTWHDRLNCGVVWWSCEVKVPVVEVHRFGCGVLGLGLGSASVTCLTSHPYSPGFHRI